MSNIILYTYKRWPLPIASVFFMFFLHNGDICVIIPETNILRYKHMSEKIGHKELHRIINRAISICVNHQDIAVNTEISAFQNRYLYYGRQNRQIDIFEDVVTSAEVKRARAFCDVLEKYRQCTDVFATEEKILSEEECRFLLKEINHYRPCIILENMPLLKVLEINFQRRLPEYKQQMLLSEYTSEACRIHDMKLNYEYQRRKGQPSVKDYEKYALHFFNSILHDKTLKDIPENQEKLVLYDACLRIVDCLPKYKYNRVTKFRLKQEINGAIKATAESLCCMAPDAKSAAQYREKAEKAGYEQNRYQKAIEKSLKFAGTNSRSRQMSIVARNKRAQDEWLYK